MVYAFWLHPYSLHVQQGTNKSLNKTTSPIFSFSRGVCYSNPTLLCARFVCQRKATQYLEGVEPRRCRHWITLNETSAPLSLWWTRLVQRVRPTISPHLFASFVSPLNCLFKRWYRRLVTIIGTITVFEFEIDKILQTIWNWIFDEFITRIWNIVCAYFNFSIFFFLMNRLNRIALVTHSRESMISSIYNFHSGCNKIK